ncbi:MAG: phosphoribosylamine--glycine ligase [Burkholderiaceae bacterium]
MKILVVGSGGREHALAWKLAQSPRVQRVYVAPGNAGTARDRRLRNFPSSDPHVLAAFAEREQIELTVVGPDAALADGIVDLFQSMKLRIFGPTRAAAELEWSKDFAKAFMQRHGIPTAPYRTFTDAAAAHAHVDAEFAARPGIPVVVKADGLAAGKGVVVAADADEAHRAIDRWLSGGSGGARLVIEGFLDGEEASFFLICDGRTALPFATAQDHKRLLDGDLGPNTGGMGAYSPATIVTPDVHARVMHQIVRPTMAGMAAEGRPFTGFLYVGLMIDSHGQPRVVEFNARMGDPETQPIVLRMKSDLVPVLEGALNATLDRVEIEWDRRTALTVVLASDGYPDAPRSGDVISGLPKSDSDDAVVFHAGTAEREGAVVTDGGRVLGVTALGDSVKIAQRRAYALAETIEFAGMQYRRDIGWRAVARR